MFDQNTFLCEYFDVWSLEYFSSRSIWFFWGSYWFLGNNGRLSIDVEFNSLSGTVICFGRTGSILNIMLNYAFCHYFSGIKSSFYFFRSTIWFFIGYLRRPFELKFNSAFRTVLCLARTTAESNIFWKYSNLLITLWT